MKYLLFIIAIVALVLSLGTCALAKGAVHEIQGIVWGVIAIVALAGAGIIEAINASARQAAAARASLKEPSEAEKT